MSPIPMFSFPIPVASPFMLGPPILTEGWDIGGTSIPRRSNRAPPPPELLGAAEEDIMRAGAFEVSFPPPPSKSSSEDSCGLGGGASEVT